MPENHRYNLFFRICSSVLILLHLVTFGPMRDVFAFSAQSASYRLNSGSLSEGGASRSTASFKAWQDAIGETCQGRAQSVSYLLNSGCIATIASSPPIMAQAIPNQSWQENQKKNDAFDLDDYLSSPDSLTLAYTVSGNTYITVKIDPTTHKVSFSQPSGWYGTEKIKFTATDTESATVESNEVSLQVEGVNNPPVLDFISDVTVNEGQLVKITPHATDSDGDPIIYTFSAPLNASGQWQTDYTNVGTYNITVTAKDSANLTDTQQVKVIVKNVNRPPVLNATPDITANETDMVAINPVAVDPDNDAISFYYPSPFDSSGKWLTDYDSAGTYNVIVTASDGIDTVSKAVKVIIKNVNRPPQVNLTLTKYTVSPNENIAVIISASDPDANLMIFSLKKDGVEIASGNISSTYTATASFSTVGSHNISVTVTDSELFSVTQTQGVDCADPNLNRDSINPVMGDFNGDALTDLGLHNSDNGTWEICLSNAGSFKSAATWLSGFGNSRDWWPIGGDFNGDARTDAGIYSTATGELKIAPSTGSNFASGNTWLTFSDVSYSWQPFTGNFNADKYTDIGFYNKDTGEVKVALCTGSGFSAPATWVNNLSTGFIALSGDFNGDSVSDLCSFNKSSGEFKVAFSNTKAFVDGSTWISGFAVNQDALISDFDNDGLADVGWWDKSTGKWSYAISTGSKFIDKGIWLGSFGASTDDSATTGDFDGNGITDAAVFDRDQLGINRWKTQLSTNKPADLLIEADNGIGGKTQVNYTYAAKVDNSALPFPVYVASSTISVNTYPSDRAAAYTQNYSFSGGYYDASEREFRGFEKVKISDPVSKNYSETYFHQGKPGQDGALKGRIYKIIAYDGNKKQISQTLNTYTVTKAGPAERFLGFPALVENTTTVYEENATSLSTKDKFTYDNIGNLLEYRSEGDLSKTGDEKSTVTTYAQAYEYPSTPGGQGFNRPLEIALEDKDGKIVSRKAFEYDNKGNLATENVFITDSFTASSTLSTTLYAYDSFGNLSSTTNALGSTITTQYETTFYAFPKKVTNALGHTVTYEYEPKFGAVTKVTDANGVISTTSYDSLSRPVQATKDDGAGMQVVAVAYSYPDFNTKIITNALNFSSTESIDGLGRKYRTVTQGEDGVNRRDVSSEVYYNNRGLTEKESLAHYIDEPEEQISYVRHEYDIRGRVKKTISDFPGTSADAQSTISYVNPLYMETIDPLGHKKGIKKDVFGNNIEITEFTSGGVYKTIYAYDIQNNLIKTTDSKNNITQIFYDSIGRKLKMIDPDMGTWTYEYDLIGNLTKQTDAKGQVVTFTYDTLNRLTAKRGQTPAGSDPVLMAAYLYDDPSKSNCIGRLSKVTDQSGSTEFFYDRAGREIESIKTIQGAGYKVQREYDLLDRLTKLSYPDGEAVQYNYDANSGLLESILSLPAAGGGEASMKKASLSI